MISPKVDFCHFDEHSKEKPRHTSSFFCKKNGGRLCHFDQREKSSVAGDEISRSCSK